MNTKYPCFLHKWWCAVHTALHFIWGIDVHGWGKKGSKPRCLWFPSWWRDLFSSVLTHSLPSVLEVRHKTLGGGTGRQTRETEAIEHLTPSSWTTMAVGLTWSAYRPLPIRFFPQNSSLPCGAKAVLYQPCPDKSGSSCWLRHISVPTSKTRWSIMNMNDRTRTFWEWSLTQPQVSAGCDHRDSKEYRTTLNHKTTPPAIL